MSASNPPTYVVSIYNPSFFTTTTTGLTQGQANGLYLQKTVSDTATVLETFSGGIATDTLNTTSPANTLQIGNSGNSGRIIISTISTSNSDTTPAISIGTDVGTRTIKINNSSNSVHLSSIDCKSSSINNIANGTGDVNIGDLQTSGAISIGCGASRLSTGGSLGTINIGTSSGNNPYAINIGNVNTPLTCNGSLSSTGLITANGGLYVSGNNNITLGTGSVVPTSTQLGYKVASTRLGVSTDVLASGITKSLASLAIPSAGVYYVFGQFSPTVSGATITLIGQNISDTLNTFATSLVNNSFGGLASTVAYTVPVCAPLSFTTATTIYLNWNSQYTGGSVTSGVTANIIFYAIRMA